VFDNDGCFEHLQLEQLDDVAVLPFLLIVVVCAVNMHNRKW